MVFAAGGRRAHPDADRRSKPGADYILGNAVLELKFLDDEGFSKPERQKKLASILRPAFPNRPVVVVDRKEFAPKVQRLFDRAIEGPIRNAVSKARVQLKQSRAEFPETNCSVLIVVNNGYTTLDHDEIKRLVIQRVSRDAHHIDAVVVAGAYVHGDGFESFSLWPMDLAPLVLSRPFRDFGALKLAWDALASRHMTDLIQGEFGEDAPKGPVEDTSFDVDGVTYVRPAPVLGVGSAFFRNGRPRKNSTRMRECPPVAAIVPSLTRPQWEEVRRLVDIPDELEGSYAEWCKAGAEALDAGSELFPTVPVAIDLIQWMQWCEDESWPLSVPALRRYATECFNRKFRETLKSVREHKNGGIVPARGILVVTEVIGQDMANDVSHIYKFVAQADCTLLVEGIAGNVRVFFEHALALGAAYAIRERHEAVLWQKDLTHAWI